MRMQKVESVRHRAAYSMAMGSKRLCQQKGDTAAAEDGLEKTCRQQKGDAAEEEKKRTGS